MQPINVKNEIKFLKKVLVHRPGNEYLNLTPSSLQRLLFDDIPYLKDAQAEHDRFADILRSEGVEVIYMVDMTAESLDVSTEIREQFIRQFIKEGGITSEKLASQLFDYLNKLTDNKQLVGKCIEGVDQTEIKGYRESSGFYATRDIGRLVLDPLPNIYAPRDPFASIGNGISLHKMFSVTRCRETIFGEYIFKYHPQYTGTKMYYDRSEGYHIEGGDIEVLSENLVAVGISERTEPDAIAELAHNLFNDKEARFNTILAFNIPDERSFMHLDTVMTRVDIDKFAVHSNVMSISSVYAITPSETPNELNIEKLNMPLDKILEKYLRLEKVTFIQCGNGNRIAAEREQWSDGANVLCIRPSVVVAYDRNFVTNEALRAHGIRVLEIPSGELSRGRGGPHCMTMALQRED